MAETKQGRLDRLYAQLQQIGEWDADDMMWALDELNKCRALLRACLSDYGDARFTDRHGMAERLRARLGVDASGAALRTEERS